MMQFNFNGEYYTYIGLKPFIILMKHQEEEVAKKLAESEYDKYIPVLRPYVKREDRQVLRERYANEGLIGYLIRIELHRPVTLEEFTQILKEEEDGR